MKSPTISVSAISIESRWKIIGEAPNYACAGESAIGGWGVGTIRKDKVCIDHRRLGKVCTVQTLHLRLPPRYENTRDHGNCAYVSIDHRRVGLRGYLLKRTQQKYQQCPLIIAASASAVIVKENRRKINDCVH